MENTNNDSNTKDLSTINLKLEEVANHFQDLVLWNAWTLLALKNASSYLIACVGGGIKIIENGEEIYIRLATEAPHYEIYGAAYINTLNTYLFYDGKTSAILRKDIDDQPPYPFIEDLPLGYKEGSFFRYSKVNNRLLAIQYVDKTQQKIVIINPEKKEVEFDLEGAGDHINELRLLGEKEDRIVAVNPKGQLVLYEVDYEQKTGSILGRHQIELSREKEEYALSVSECQKQKYLYVEIARKGEGDTYLCSRIAIFRLDGDNFVQETIVDMSGSDTSEKYQIHPCGYAGKYALWVGFSFWNPRVCHLYAFDTESGELRELKEKNQEHGLEAILKVERLDGKFYFTGNGAKVLRLSVDL